MYNEITVKETQTTQTEVEDMNRTEIREILRAWMLKHNKEEIREHLENKWLSYDIDTDDYEIAIEELNGIA